VKSEWPLTDDNFKAGCDLPPHATKKTNAEAAQKEATAASVATSESPTPRRWIITLAAIVAMLATLFAVVSLASMSSSQEISAAVSTRMQFEAINQTGMQMPTNFIAFEADFTANLHCAGSYATRRYQPEWKDDAHQRHNRQRFLLRRR